MPARWCPTKCVFEGLVSYFLACLGLLVSHHVLELADTFVDKHEYFWLWLSPYQLELVELI
jgi:hypothetical protein